MLILFWLFAAALTVGVVLWLAPVLLRVRDDPRASRREANIAIYRQRLQELETQRNAGTLAAADYEPLRAELEAQAAQDLRASTEPTPAAGARGSRSVALIVLILLPVAAVTLYHYNGGNRPWDDILTLSALGGEASDLERRSAVDELAVVLEREVAVNPGNARAWTMLGQAYVALERFEDGRDAFARRMRIGQPGAADLIEYAEARALAEGGRFDDESRRLLRAALAREPEEPRGLWLAGFAALQAGEGEEALRNWERLQDLLPVGNPLRDSLAPYMHAARQRVAATADESEPTPHDTADELMLEIEVGMDDALADAVSEDDTLFVFARSPHGPAMPVAASRLAVTTFPVYLTLGASDSPMPGRTLVDVDDVVVEARISRSGSVERETGDLYGRSGTVNLNGDATNRPPLIRIVIDTIQH